MSLLNLVSNLAIVDGEERRQCWVCFATEEDDERALWVKPCRCRGSSRWVHDTCLQRWIDEKQRGNPSQKVLCPQCNTEYIIIFPKSNTLVLGIEALDGIVQKVSPFAAGAIVLGSLYWSAVTYGAVTVMQVLGHQEGLSTMEKADPLLLILGLPAIPVALVLGKLVRWEDVVLRLYRHYSFKLANYLKSENSQVGGSGGSNSAAGAATNPALETTDREILSVSRIFCGAICLPTMATLFGKLFFNHMRSNLQRTLVGGLTFVLIKGLVKLYLRQSRYSRKLSRKVMDYDLYVQTLRHQDTQTDPLPTTTTTGPSSAPTAVSGGTTGGGGTTASRPGPSRISHSNRNQNQSNDDDDEFSTSTTSDGSRHRVDQTADTSSLDLPLPAPAPAATTADTAAGGGGSEADDYEVADDLPDNILNPPQEEEMAAAGDLGLSLTPPPSIGSAAD